MPKRRTNHAPKLANRTQIAGRRGRLLALVNSLPEASAVACGGTHLSLEVRGRRFGYYLDDHHADGRIAINCKAEPGGNQTLIDFAPERFHLPAYLGARGWVGLWLDLPSIDWEEVESVLTDAYRLTAPRRLVALLEGR